jgi:hypothetical protein
MLQTRFELIVLTRSPNLGRRCALLKMKCYCRSVHLDHPTGALVDWWTWMESRGYGRYRPLSDDVCGAAKL